MKVELLPSAWEGLISIKYRIQADFGENAALQAASRILDDLERLELFPNLGVPTPDPWLNAMGYKMLVSGKRSISIFRKIDDRIFVYIIADTRTEYTKLFKQLLLSDSDDAPHITDSF